MRVKYYVVSIDPQAEREWDRLILRNPINGEHPDLDKIVADAIGNEAGSYLIAIEMEIKILEQNRQINGNKVVNQESLQKITPTKISKLVAL